MGPLANGPGRRPGRAMARCVLTHDRTWNTGPITKKCTTLSPICLAAALRGPASSCHPPPPRHCPLEGYFGNTSDVTRAALPFDKDSIKSLNCLYSLQWNVISTSKKHSKRSSWNFTRCQFSYLLKYSKSRRRRRIQKKSASSSSLSVLKLRHSSFFFTTVKKVL